MKFIAYTFKGLEEITAREIKGKKINEKRILFSKKKNFIGSAVFSYELVREIKYNDLKDLINKIKKIKISIKGKFSVDCNKDDNDKLNSQETRAKIGEIFHNRNYKVDLENPRTIIFIDINKNTCFLGKNPVYYKRNYKVRSSRDSINSVVGYSLLKIADYNKKEILVDPFCSDGVILIEAGLLGGKKLYGFNEDIKNARINAKVAKVKIEFSTNTVDWLDTVFKKESVDKIITKTPFVSKTKSEEYVNKTIKEFFYQASYILKKNGLIVTLSPKTELLEKYSEEYKFKREKETEVRVGDINYKIHSFKRSL